MNLSRELNKQYLKQLQALFLIITLFTISINFVSAGNPASQTNPPLITQETTGDNFYMYEKEEFIFIHLEGDSHTIGYLHGKNLAERLQRALDAYAHCSLDWHDLSWDQVRRQAMPYWYHVPSEYRLEIEGIAEGAAEMGVQSPAGGTVDWIDILGLNAQWDIWWRASPPGNPFWWWPFQGGEESPPLTPSLSLADGGTPEASHEQINKEGSKGILPLDNPHHCSAFVAAGDATKDGGIVLGQSLWMPYFLPPAHAIFMDLVPPDGNRIVMEVTAGMIWSGTEWYVSSGGLIVAETTLGTGPYIYGNKPAFVRIREAVQYANSIDEFRDIMLEDSNGAYCGDYILGDVNTGEAAILELGAYEYELARTKNGFLGSCNYPWDPEVAEEMGAPQGWDHGCYPRYVRWQQLSDQYYGEITTEHGKMFIGDHYDTVEDKINPCSHTLCGHVENASGYPHGSMDAKVTNSSMAKRLESWTRYGHSCGEPFLVDAHRQEHPEYSFPDLQDMIAGNWTTFGPVVEVNVQVVDEDGDPVGGADVEFKSRLDNTTWIVTTNDVGLAQFPYHQCSDYTLTVTKNDAQQVEHVIITAPENIEIILRSPQDDTGFGTAFQIAIIFIAIVALLVIFYFLKTKYRRNSRGS